MTNFAKVSSLIFLDNMRCVADLIFGGVCHRFPDLKLVSVESGVGWIPAALETFDWQWRNGGVLDEHPEYDLLPSEYFRRQIYGCFWFEEQAALDAIAQYPDNILLRDRLPAPDVPAPRARARRRQRPRDYATSVLGGLPDDVAAQGAARQRRRGLRPRERADLDAPDLGSRAPRRRRRRPRAAPARRPGRAAQRVHPGHVPRHQAGRDLGRPRSPSSTRCASPAPTTGSAPAATWPAGPRTPRASRLEWDGTDHFPFRHIERCRKLWVAKINGPASPAGSTSRCTAT